jgi:hypothetical protein
VIPAFAYFNHGQKWMNPDFSVPTEINGDSGKINFLPECGALICGI